MFVQKLVKPEGIKVLFIGDQKTYLIPFGLAEALPNLTELMISGAELKILTKLDFKGLKSLEEITITSNDISEIDEGVFDEVPKLIHLNLAYNNIKSLPGNAFAELTNLKTLVLSGNSLVTFTASLLPRKNVIKELQLQKNRLDIIEREILKLLKNAELVDLSDNTCVNMKYQKSDANSTTLKEIWAHVEFECSNSED